MNYFILFDLPSIYNINIKILNIKYQKLQHKYHPDRFITHSKDKKKYALQKSTIINTGYQVLKHPLYRAEYLLTLNNIDINNENYFINSESFFKEQMDLWEELKNIENNKESKEKINIFSLKINKKISVLYSKINQHFKSKEWMKISTIIIKLRFLNKLVQYIEELEKKVYFD